ncbi:conjugal transfer protein TrbI [Sphingomonas sp. SUN019]|uniref:TrbI/VirB10 family protein n=1 Tax=Sphingomonas sp. SUN019 TaxID=2937788 RepID=UPI0021642F70|nr:TrbI/VirB10 family protein [Sphingomonas sp. SUN019]UVO50192.1 conjugal transfer protein TrbI [Sphingomonas sp. SUN019]
MLIFGIALFATLFALARVAMSLRIPSWHFGGAEVSERSHAPSVGQPAHVVAPPPVESRSRAAAVADAVAISQRREEMIASGSTTASSGGGRYISPAQAILVTGRGSSTAVASPRRTSYRVSDGRRRALTAPAVVALTVQRAPFEAPPPLYIPPEPRFVSPPVIESAALPQAVPLPREPRQQTVVPTIQQQPLQRVDYAQPPIVERPQRTGGGATLVLDTSQPRSGAADGEPTAAASPLSENNANASRTRAGTIANRTMTVPQGTIVPAVLETAFNSTRAGFARALVQRDVHGLDGRRVLIPRGSRLIGEYRSDAAAGQKRALINWTRLIRPDGATIAIGSPATDPVGIGGIKAKVDSHFFARFGGAILQSVLDVGVNLASRSVDSPVIVALPGSVQGTTATITRQTDIPPTLSVRQGTSVSVFVARDLDFTEVESRR